MKPSIHEYAKFLDHVITDDSGACWIWQGSVNRTTGYGQYRCPRRGTIVTAHRWMYQFQNPDQLLTHKDFVMHTCDVKHCVNPTHLVLGDHKANMRDRDNKGRNPGNPYGRKGKLTASAIKDIRSSKIPKIQLARKHQVPVTTIYKILKGKLYSKY
jgi:hypothetical protein